MLTYKLSIPNPKSQNPVDSAIWNWAFHTQFYMLEALEFGVKDAQSNLYKHLKNMA